MPGTNRLPPLLALLFVLAALSACGSDEIDGEIPQEDATALKAELSAVRDAVAVQNCDDASSAVEDFGDLVDQLPATAGTELKIALRDAGDNLQGLVSQQCASTGTTTDTTNTEPTATEPPTTDETTTTTDEATTTTDETTTTTDETTPDGNGGGPPDGGPPDGGPPGNGGTGGTGGGTGDESDD